MPGCRDTDLAHTGCFVRIKGGRIFISNCIHTYRLHTVIDRRLLHTTPRLSFSMLSLVRSRAFRPATGGLSLSKRTLVLGSAPRLAREAPLDGLQQIIPGTEIQRDITPATKATGLPYWQRIPRWRDITEEQFKSYSWQVSAPASICDDHLELTLSSLRIALTRKTGYSSS
jgi:hypothetical protein